jgi:hypothetical protein
MDLQRGDAEGEQILLVTKTNTTISNLTPLPVLVDVGADGRLCHGRMARA